MAESPVSTRGWKIRPFYNDNGRLVAYYKFAYRKVYYYRNYVSGGRIPFVYYFDFKVNLITGKVF